MTRVLDAHALMVFLEKEPGWRKVAGRFAEAVERADRLLMTTVNYGEVLYIILRECGPEQGEAAEDVVRSLPVEFVPVDLDLTREAARFKASHSISYADCFAAALARTRKAELITGDREFALLEKSIKIDWL